MSKLTMFIQPRCPFCIKALKYIDEAKSAHAELSAVEIEVVDELTEVARADSYDYYYVPTFFLGDKKLHEGGIYADEVEALLRSVVNGEV
ncbi:MAG: glutaredoxin domain-containing protein [Rikenellaceae bacterium]